jgi:hypothetical protein
MILVFFLVLKIYRLINLLLLLEFIFILVIFLFLILNKLFNYFLFLIFGVFSSVICIVIFLKYVVLYGSDFVKF